LQTVKKWTVGTLGFGRKNVRVKDVAGRNLM